VVNVVLHNLKALLENSHGFSEMMEKNGEFGRDLARAIADKTDECGEGKTVGASVTKRRKRVG
jgi:hypothetical protein